MTRKEIIQQELDTLLYDRLTYFYNKDSNFIKSLVYTINNSGSSTNSKSCKFRNIAIYQNNKFIYLTNRNYISMLRKIKSNATIYNENAITKFLEEHDYVKINYDDNYIFITKGNFKKLIKTYNL